MAPMIGDLAMTSSLRRVGSNGRQSLILMSFFIATIAVRLGLAWGLSGYHIFRPLNPDAYEYRHLAGNLLEYGRYGFGPNWRSDPHLAASPWRFLYDDDGFSMFRPPGYPFFLAGLQWIGLGSVVAEQAVLATIDGFTAVALYVLARSLFGSGAAIFASILFLLNPGSAYALTKGGREPFLALFFTLGFLLILATIRQPRTSLAVLAGLWFGSAGYFKETLSVVGILMGLMLLWVGLWRRRSLAHAAVVIIICTVLPLFPWVLRNSLAQGTLIPAPSLTGMHMNVTIVDPHWIRSQPPTVQSALDPWKAANPLQADQILSAQTRAYASDQPIAFVRALARNALYFWLPFPVQVTRPTGVFGPAEALALVYYISFFALTAASLWVHRRREETWFILAILLAMTAVHVFNGMPRYRFPFEPVLAVFAGDRIRAWYRQCVSLPSHLGWAGRS